MIIVFGAGISGLGAVKLLESKGKEVALIDDKVSKLKTEDGLRFIEEKEIEYIVKSPGISFKSKLITKAMEKNIPIYSEIDIAYEYMDKNIEIIAFTGTNGKTTTCTKTYELFKKAGFRVELGGNVGKSYAEIVYENKELDYIVLELSSYQLEHSPKIKPKIAGIINLTPDHLSRYDSIEDYYLTKFNIFRNQDKKDYVIVNMEDNNFISLSDKVKDSENYTKPKRLFVSKQDKGNIFIHETDIYIMKDLSSRYNPKFNIHQQAEVLMNKDEISLKGEHNLENTLFIIAAAKICNIPNKVIKNFLVETKSIEHRMEEFFKISESIFVNDSKGTNVDSTIKAINSYKEDECLICGGEDKKVPLEELAKSIKNKVEFTFIYGENRFLIENELKKVGYNKYKLFETVDECIDNIKESYKFDIKRYFLFSPATSSFDQFTNFEKRGEYFKNIVFKKLGDINV